MEREGEGSCCRLQETNGNQNNAAFRSCLISAQISPECGAKFSLNTATPQQQGSKELQTQMSHQCEKSEHQSRRALWQGEFWNRNDGSLAGD
jgi:hypothetical protein